MRSMCAAAAALTVGLLLAFADDKKPGVSAEARADRLKSLVAKYEKELGELKKRFEAARDPGDKQGIRAEARELAILTSQDAVKLAEEEPGDATAFEACTFVVEKAAALGAAKEVDAVAKIVTDHHLSNAKVKDLLPKLVKAGPAGQTFLQAAAEKSSDKTVKGLANFFLGLAIVGQLDEEEDGKKADEMAAKAKEHFKAAETQASDATVGTTTVSKAVAEQLDLLRVLKSIAIGKAVPDEIEGTDLDGKKIKLTSYKGKVVLLDIWATWCGPCRSMIPHEREMVKKLKDKPFVLLSVSCDQNQDDLVGFLKDEKMPWQHWFDGSRGAIAKAFRVQAFPTLYLIDHSGVLRKKYMGVPNASALEKAVEDLVEDAVKAKG